MRGGPRDGPTEEASPRPHTGKEEKGLPHTPSKEKKYIYNYLPESVSLSGVNARERHSQGLGWIGGFGGKEGKGPGLVHARVALRVHVRPRATCAPHTRYDAGAHNARARVCSARGEGGGVKGGREPQGGTCPVCGPVLGWIHDHETRDPCNHQCDHEGDRL